MLLTLESQMRTHLSCFCTSDSSSAHLKRGKLLEQGIHDSVSENTAVAFLGFGLAFGLQDGQSSDGSPSAAVDIHPGRYPDRDGGGARGGAGRRES
jgi:hypothetical protein